MHGLLCSCHFLHCIVKSVYVLQYVYREQFACVASVCRAGVKVGFLFNDAFHVKLSSTQYASDLREPLIICVSTVTESEWVEDTFSP